MNQPKKLPQHLSAHELIAPCGMNCALCVAYQRKRNRCPGCRVDDPNKPRTRRDCKIRNCKIMRRNGKKFCAGCKCFPCAWLSRLDARYRANYGMSMIENLNDIDAGGLRNFVETEKSKWACSGCGKTICVHQPACPACHRRRR